MTVLKLAKCLFAYGFGQTEVMERRNNTCENEIEALILLILTENCLCPHT